jgi:hypothetical protein
MGRNFENTPNVTFFSICSIPDIFVKHIEYNLIFNSAKYFQNWFISLRDIAGQTLQKSCVFRAFDDALYVGLSTWQHSNICDV